MSDVRDSDTSDAPDARDDLAIALGGLDDCLKFDAHSVHLARCVQAIARLREEDSTERDVYRREVARLAKQCDLLVGRVATLESRVGPPDDGR